MTPSDSNGNLHFAAVQVMLNQSYYEVMSARKSALEQKIVDDEAAYLSKNDTINGIDNGTITVDQEKLDLLNNYPNIDAFYYKLYNEANDMDFYKAEL